MRATKSNWKHLTFVLVVATILFLCPTEVQGDETCSCASFADGGCAPNQVSSPDGNNNKVNVAYGKHANMSSTYDANLPACAAVNGRTSHTMINGTDRNCVHTGFYENNSYWQVDLGQTFTITDVTVYSRTGQLDRLTGIDILVDCHLCKKLPDRPDQTSIYNTLTSTIPCDQPVTGRVVKFSKYATYTTADWNFRIINFCEVQIWVCKPGLYGQYCDGVCNCPNHATCDNYYGTCQNGDDTCSCASECNGGCDPNQVCDPHGNCNKVNVAYGKHASMSSMHYDHLPACAAVNGRTSGTPSFGADRNCVHTAADDNNPYWQVDLGQNFTITDVTVYSRTGQKQRLAGIEILVDSQPCKKIRDSSIYQLTSTISCDSPVTGSVVKFYKYETNLYNAGKFINFCELQIWVCKPGLYGQDCDQMCHCRNNDTCNNYNGSCPNECKDGYYGAGCAENCGHCKKNASCNKTTGQCPGGLCGIGYQSPLCQEKCANKTYGDNCSHTCGHCENAAACEVFIGTCPACEGNFSAPFCIDCNDGYHGAGCTEQCGQCKDNATCDKNTGHCPGLCEAGYQPSLCKGPCVKKMYGDNCSHTCGHCKNAAACDVFNGTCSACEGNFLAPFCTNCSDGHYGAGCAGQCGQCQDNAVCDKTTGQCPGGLCATGYRAPLCNETCIDKMYGDNCSHTCGHCKNAAACDVFNGKCSTCEGNFSAPFCKDCSDGHYGAGCAGQCGQCKDNAFCDKTTGQCPGGLCETGYRAPFCNETCTNQMYGDNCSHACGHCESAAACDVFNGTCSNCEGNFFAPFCTECNDGYHDAGCTEQCGQCKDNGVCDKTTGQCPGLCETGYQPSFCNETCTNTMYGDNCSQQCGRCENHAACDVFDGKCLACDGNFSAPLCKECTDGHHGSECTECGQCKGDTACDKVTGHCPDGCQAGYQHADCKSECDNGYHGNNCSNSCGQCLEEGCDKSTGSCSLQGCQPGFDPPLCTSETPKDSNSAVIGGTVAAVLVVAAAVAVGAVILVRRRRSSKDGSKTRTDLQLTDLTSPNTGAPGRPTAAVPPSTWLRTNGKDNSADQHIYSNVPAASQTPAGSRPPVSRRPASLRPASRRSVTRAQRPEAEAAAAPTRAVESEDENFGDEDDEDPVYGNAGNIYTTLQATKPELDDLQKYLVDRLASAELPAEFKTISKIDESLSTDAGKLTINKKKNRFAAIIPYDRSRVTLTDGDKSTDYVNASYVQGHQVQGGSKYIAAQGPRDNTVADFWRLVWQEKITHIVMLTNVQEKGRSKCYQYWPEDEGSSTTWDPVTVTTTRVELRGYFYIRTFRVKRDKVSREVTQYHYVSWPDHGVPTTTSLVRFWRDVSSRTRDDRAPLLVHCSAGVGRTGTYIGLDIGMKAAVRHGKLNVLDLVKRMRQERTLMVQAVEQYGFLHEALLEAYTARDTQLTTDQFDVIFPDTVSANTPSTRIDAEFKALMQMQPLSCEKARKTAAEKVNMTKNRNYSTLPFDEHLVYLTEHVAGRNQYVNAVFMPTFRDPKGSILTQLPLPSTLVDFWRLVYGNDVTTIVSLCSPHEDKEVAPYYQYWPRERTEPVATGPYTVTLTSKTTDRNSLSSYTLQLHKTGVSVPRSVRVQHYEGWTGEEGGQCADMLTLLDTVLSSSADRKSPPLLVQCSDGVSKSGLFSALCDIINHMTYDRQCDVYMAVRHVQTVSPHAVASIAQYRYCYKIAQQRQRDMSVYANT